jgi:hypothetical protein
MGTRAIEALFARDGRVIGESLDWCRVYHICNPLRDDHTETHARIATQLFHPKYQDKVGSRRTFDMHIATMEYNCPISHLQVQKLNSTSAFSKTTFDSTGHATSIVDTSVLSGK